MSQNQNGSICAEEYVVKRGDSFYLIAHKLGVPLRDLLAANRDIHPARLMVGDVLCIPREEDDRPQGSGNTGGGSSNSGSGDNHIGGGRPGESNGNGSNGGNSSGNDASGSNSSNGASGSNSNTSGSGASGGNSSNGSAANNSSNGAANGNSSLTGGATGNGSYSGSGNTGNSTSNNNSNGTDSVTPAPSPAPSPAPGLSCPIEEQVTLREGETVADIQLQNLLSRNTLQTANPSVDLDALRAGQTICVPPENIACTLPSTYTLAAGETLEAVAMRFNLPLGSLLRVNPCLAPQDFEEGVTVILPR